MLVLVLAVTAIWYGVNSSREEPAGQPEPPGNSMLPDGGNNVQDGEPELETPLPPAVELISASGRETIYSVSGTEEIQVKLTFRELCWVQLKTDGAEAFYPRSFQRGEELEATAAGEIWIRLGNPPGQ